MGKNSFLWSLRFVDKGKRVCIVKYVKSVMIKKVKYFTQTVDKVPDKSPGQKSRLFLCFSYPQFFFVELLYQEKSVCYPPDSFIQSIPFVV